MKNLLLCLWLLSAGSFLAAQPLRPWAEVPVAHAQGPLPNPWAGGLNLPQISVAQVAGGPSPELIVFDRAGQQVLVFEREAGEWRHRPAWSAGFPPLSAWMLVRDYTCDGWGDLFASLPDSTGIRTWVHEGSPAPAFLPGIPLLREGGSPIYVAPSDIPAISDIDGDGKLDILAFDAQGLRAAWHRNTAANPCASPDYILADACWGKFAEAGLTNEITLGLACKQEGGPEHAGSTLLAFDPDQDGDQDLILGDLTYPSLVFLHNGGSPAAADMTSVGTSFPDYDEPVNIRQFAAAFFEDIDADGKRELIAAPTSLSISLNARQVWLYEDIGPPGSPYFSLQTKEWLVGGMIDVGELSHPVFWDENGDGKLDLLLGNAVYRDQPDREGGTLTLYRNVGSTEAPAFELLTRNYLDLPSLFTPRISGLRPAVGDLDGDGDLDLVIGDQGGRIHRFTNLAGPGQPALLQLSHPSWQGIDVGGSATPQIADINRDQLPDLIVGEQGGTLNYFQNTGSASNPQLTLTSDFWGQIDTYLPCCTGYSVPWLFENAAGQYELLLGAEDGRLLHYGQIEGNLSGAFQLISDTFGSIREGLFPSPAAADLDQDGNLEWVIGNRRGGAALYRQEKSEALSPALPAQEWLRVQPDGQGGCRFTLSPALREAELSLITLNGARVAAFRLRGGESASLGRERHPPGMYIWLLDAEAGQQAGKCILWP